MKLKAIQIKNYKSILDSNVCYINPELTIFAGKNESGKSNILTAIQHLSLGKFDKNDHPSRKPEYLPSVDYQFLIDADDYDILDAKLNGLLKKCFIKSEDFNFTLLNDGTIKLAQDNLIKKLQNQISVEQTSQLSILNKEIKKLGVDKNFSTYEEVQNFKTSFSESDTENFKEINCLLDDFLANANVMITQNMIDDAIKGLLPNLVYFNSFKDNLPDVINKEYLDPNNEHYTIVKRLFKYLNIDESKIFFNVQNEDEDTERNDYLKSLEKTISDDLFEKYKQKPIKLGFRMSSFGGLNIDVYDADARGNIPQGDLAYRISDRSEGFRWFLSFYITLKGEKFSNKDIILIDEPGLYLHATAQKDMLNIFLEESKKHQIIFTTHSPYLIDVNNLSRIRLVEKNKKKLSNTNFEETKIISSIIKGSDNETITPIADAIGYNLSEGLTINHDKMAIVEGPSDYFYITKMASILGVPLNCNIIPAGGAPKISNICAILFGFKVKNITCVYDNDQAGINALKENEKILGFENIRHVLISEIKNYEVEDLFSTNDFDKHVTKNMKGLKNSKLVEKLNKTLLAKIFSNKELTIQDFEKETIDNFTNIIKRINNERDAVK